MNILHKDRWQFQILKIERFKILQGNEISGQI